MNMGGCISRTSILHKEMFAFRFFPHWFFSDKLLRLATTRLRISRLVMDRLRVMPI